MAAALFRHGQAAARYTGPEAAGPSFSSIPAPPAAEPRNRLRTLLFGPPLHACLVQSHPGSRRWRAASDAAFLHALSETIACTRPHRRK